MRKLIEPIAVPLIEYAARSYVAGSKVSDAIDLALAAQDIGFNCTLCYWNDGKEPPPEVAEKYIDLLNAMRRAKLDGYLALKIPALLDSADLTERVVDHARAQGTHVIFDSHAPAQSTTTFDILERIGGEGVGCAIPGRWRRSRADADRAIELGATIRVVKGQWPDPEDPDKDLAHGYMEIIDHIAGRCKNVGVATHNATLAQDAIARLQEANATCEQELVFPLPVDDVRAVAVDAGLSSRLYIPFGKSWLPYSLGRAAKNPKMLFWLVRDLVTNKRFKLPRRAAVGEAS